MKKLMILAGLEAENPKKRHIHYHAFHRKDTIMTYIQVSVAIAAVLVVGTGLYLTR